MGESESTRILMGVNESTIKGYPNPSISSKGAFEWTVRKIIRSNTSAFKLLFLHVQVPDEDGAFLSPFLLFYLKSTSQLFNSLSTLNQDHIIVQLLLIPFSS